METKAGDFTIRALRSNDPEYPGIFIEVDGATLALVELCEGRFQTRVFSVENEDVIQSFETKPSEIKQYIEEGE